MLKNIFFVSLILGVALLASAHHLDDDSRLALRFRYDETMGTLNVNDTSANRHVGTMNNFVGNPFDVGQRINQLTFDGTNDYVTVPDADSLDLSAITILVWAEGDIGDGDRALFRKNGAYSMYVTGGSVLLGDGNGPGSITGPTTLHDNVRYFFGYTYNGVNTQRLYINGTVEATRSATGTVLPNANELNLGRFEGGTGFWDGTQDEARLYNVALTPQEISNIYTFERGQDIGAQTLTQTVTTNTITVVPTITNVTVVPTITSVTVIPTITNVTVTVNATGNASMAEILDAVEILTPIFLLVALIVWAEVRRSPWPYWVAIVLDVLVVINIWTRFDFMRIVFIVAGLVIIIRLVEFYKTEGKPRSEN